MTRVAETEPSTLSTPSRRLPTALFAVLGVAAAVIGAVILFGDLPRPTIGGLGLLLLLVMMALGIPIGLTMIVVGTVGVIGMSSLEAAALSAKNVVFDSIASWSLSVVPLFVLMGVALWKGGMTTRAYTAAHHWLGRLPGGLAFATTVGGAGLATTSGSTIGISYALGRMSVPEMLRAGYSPRLATGSVAMAGTLGQVIPPSILIVIYAGVAQAPVGPALLAGVVPGVALCLAYGMTIVGWGLLRPADAPRADLTGVSWRTRFAALRGAIPLLVIALVILGGMLSGLFTANEAAGVGALAAIVMSWAMQGRGERGPRKTWHLLRSTVRESITSLAGLFVLVIGSYLLSRLLTLSGLAQYFSEWITELGLGRVALLLVLMAVYVVLGMFLESLPMILLTVPLLQAPLEAAGVDMLWFGVFIVIMCEIGMVFPPVGLLTFIVHRMVQDPGLNLGRRIPLSDVFRGIIPFVAAALVVALVLILWPDIALWLPATSAGE